MCGATNGMKDKKHPLATILGTPSFRNSAVIALTRLEVIKLEKYPELLKPMIEKNVFEKFLPSHTGAHAGEIGMTREIVA